jgi:hypothetical protein
MGRYDYSYDHEQNPMEGDEGTSIRDALGEVIISFEELDDMLATSVSFMLRRGDEVGRIVTAPLSFRAKVDMFGALFKADRPQSTILELINQLCAGCLQIEEERNKIVHSKWRNTFDNKALSRSKFTARAKHGLKEAKETWQPGRFISVWVHCGYLTHEIDSWMFAEYGKEYGPMEDDPVSYREDSMRSSAF